MSASAGYFLRALGLRTLFFVPTGLMTCSLLLADTLCKLLTVFGSLVRAGVSMSNSTRFVCTFVEKVLQSAPREPEEPLVYTLDVDRTLVQQFVQERSTSVVREGACRKCTSPDLVLLLLRYIVRSLRASDFVSARVFLQVITDTRPYLTLHRCPEKHPLPSPGPVVELCHATTSDARKIVIDFLTEKVLAEHAKKVTKMARVTGTMLRLLILAYETVHGLPPPQEVSTEELAVPDTKNTIMNTFLSVMQESPEPLCSTCRARVRLPCVLQYLALAYEARDIASLEYLLTVLRLTTVLSDRLDCSSPTSRETLKRKTPEVDSAHG